MSKSLIQTTNQSVQNVSVGNIIDLGSVQRRYGPNLKLSGSNAIEIIGEGYYTITASISVAPTAIGEVSIGAYVNGVQLPGAIAVGSVSTADNSTCLTIIGTVRKGCCCEGADNLTLVLISGASNVSNVSLRVEKS